MNNGVLNFSSVNVISPGPQSVPVQLFFFDDPPLQPFPPFSAGRTTLLVAVCLPAPQATEQAFHCPQPPHLQSTEREWQIFTTVVFDTVHIRCKVHTCVQSKLIFYGRITLQVISFTKIELMFEKTYKPWISKERDLKERP